MLTDAPCRPSRPTCTPMKRKLARDCSFYPGAVANFDSGQNLYAGWGVTPTAESVLTAWTEEEISNYDVGLAASYECVDSRKPCGHYTQVMCEYPCCVGSLHPGTQAKQQPVPLTCPCSSSDPGETSKWVGCAGAIIPYGACAKCDRNAPGNRCLPSLWDGGSLVACNYRQPGNCGNYIFKPAGGVCDLEDVPY